MKKILLLIGLIVLVAAGTFVVVTQIDDLKAAIDKLAAPNQNINNPVSIPVVQTKLQYYKDDAFGLYVVLFDKNPEFFYQQDPNSTVKELVESKNWLYATNGSYFLQDYSHAGFLMVDGEIQNQIARTDKQVTHIVVMDSNVNSTEFFDAKSFSSTKYLGKVGVTAFQTGPLVIDANQIQTVTIESSNNGLGSYLRTLFGVTKSGKKFFAVVTKSQDLKTIGKKLLELPLFKDEIISVINLDGGSSTTMYSSENKDFNFRSYKQLPIILGVKE